MKRILMLVLLATLAFALVPAAYAQGFLLVSPTGATLIRDLDVDLASMSWQPLAGATNYVLSVFKVSNNPRASLGELFTQSFAPGSCGATCVHNLSGGQLALFDRGAYAWTVVANTPGGDVEASNGAIFFSYEPAAIALLANPGFEDGIPAPWTTSNLNGDAVEPGAGNGGSFGFQFKGSSGENSLIKQKVLTAFYAIDSSDSLTFSADYKAAKPNVLAKIVLKIVYTTPSGLSADKVTFTAVQSTVFSTSSAIVTPDGPVKKIQVNVTHNSVNGKFTVDNIQVTLAAQP